MNVVECIKCGTTYERTLHELKEPEKEEFRCIVCNELIERWDSSRYPTFTQIGGTDYRFDAS